MSYQTENSNLLYGFTAIFGAAAIAACIMGLGHPLMLVGVYVVYKCLGSFFDGLNNNPKNRR